MKDVVNVVVAIAQVARSHECESTQGMISKMIIQAVLVIAARDDVNGRALLGEEVKRRPAEVEDSIATAAVVIVIIHDVGLIGAEWARIFKGGNLGVRHPLPFG